MASDQEGELWRRALDAAQSIVTRSVPCALSSLRSVVLVRVNPAALVRRLCTTNASDIQLVKAFDAYVILGSIDDYAPRNPDRGSLLPKRRGPQSEFPIEQLEGSSAGMPLCTEPSHNQLPNHVMRYFSWIPTICHLSRRANRIVHPGCRSD